MIVYEIYQHPQWGYTAVRTGFSWPAFLAPSVWAAARGLGSVTLLLVICSTLMFDVLKIAAVAVSQPAMMLLLFSASYLLFGLRPGIEGNYWHISKLRQEGYHWRYTVVAKNRRHALQAAQNGRLINSPLLLLANACHA